MQLAIAALVLGALIGFALPVRSTRFARPRARWLPLLGLGLVGQVWASRLDEAAALPVVLASFAALIAFGCANLQFTGMGVVTIGLCCNLLPILVNGGMPVRPEALVHAEVVDAAELPSVELSGARHVETTSDHLVVLGDIIPFRAIGSVVSFGDLIIAMGTADVVAHLVRRQRRTPFSITNASPVHDWGTAPSPEPSSGSQYSASPETSAPDTVDVAMSAPASHSR